MSDFTESEQTWDDVSPNNGDSNTDTGMNDINTNNTNPIPNDENSPASDYVKVGEPGSMEDEDVPPPTAKSRWHMMFEVRHFHFIFIFIFFSKY